MREIVIDTETTGLDPLGGHRVVEIGAVELVDHAPTGRTFHCYLNPERTVPADAISVRAPDYPVIFVWSCFLLFIGVGAFVVGMAIHNEATAKPPAPRHEQIYYCATGEEILLYQPCKNRKDQRDI